MELEQALSERELCPAVASAVSRSVAEAVGARCSFVDQKQSCAWRLMGILVVRSSILAFDSEIESNAVYGLSPSATSDSTSVLALAVPVERATYPAQEVVRDSAVQLVLADGVQVQNYSRTSWHAPAP